MALTDPKKLARRQLERDRKKTVDGHVGKPLGRILFARKIARMRVSPFAFLRGAAPMFYELLAERPQLASGPEGKGWLAGDLHLENFGAYHPEHVHLSPEHKRETKAGAKHAREHQARVVFGLNDFDDAVRGPFRLDVLRLLTSIVLAGRELGCDGVTSIQLSRAFLEGYRTKKPSEAAMVIPGPVLALVEQVATRTRTELLAGRTELHHGKRRFVRGERYADLPAKLMAEVPKALGRYAASLSRDRKEESGETIALEELELVDAALRIAGTGSLGGLRIAALVQGKGGPNGGFVFDLKEQGDPSASVLLGRSPLPPAERVLAAFRATASPPPRLLGTSRIERTPLFVRRLMPQEDKLDLAHIAAADLEPLAAYLGLLVGDAHGRGAGTGAPRNKIVRWSKVDGEAMVDRALTVAGIHESVYLAYCKLVLDEMTHE